MKNAFHWFFVYNKDGGDKMTTRKIVLIDGSSLAYRAFYSILDLERFKNQAGLHTNALYSFYRMLDNLIKQFDPTHIMVAFDQAGPTFRTEMYQEYKGGRQSTPPELKEQMPYLRVLLDAFGIQYYDMAEFEADDIIGTLAYQADSNDQVHVISGDRDLIQLASPQTTVHITRRGVSDLVEYTPETIEEEYGITPRQIIDLKGLVGDSSDNYPGVTRIGEKTGLKLLYEYHSIPELYERIDELKPSKMKENLINERDIAFMCRDLAEIKRDIDLKFKLDDFAYHGRDIEALIEFNRSMNFNSFLSDLMQDNPVDFSNQANEVPDAPDYEINYLKQIESTHLPDAATIYFETLRSNYHEEPIQAVAWYDISTQKAFVSEADIAFDSEEFRAWLEDPMIPKTMFDSKRTQVLAHRNGVELKGIDFDCLIAAYLVMNDHLKEIPDILREFNIPLAVAYDEAVYGKGKKIAWPSEEVWQPHLASKVVALSQLVEPLKERLKTLDMMELYTDIDMPVARVLSEMEITGIKVDPEILQAKSEEIEARLLEIEKDVFQLAGESFNLNSPKQLGEILFEKLNLPVIKKTKTGYSTSADVLEKLQHQHPIIELILDYRQLNKLQGTYLIGLQDYIQADGKIHTHFVQTLTQTGRLSSTDPNLQNIPIRIEEGRKIRQAFVPSEPGWQLFSADYSQIELRVLAHISGDKAMQQAFIDGEDIHSATARAIFHLDDDQKVTPNDRRQAKAVNFGIVYGISDYGLSQNLNISRAEAKRFIDRYLETYSGIHQFMEKIVEQAKKDGYVSTLFHRRRYLPDIHSSNFNVRSFAERTALNSPIQGTAADIIKIAMIRLAEKLEAMNLSSRILLQVHDELILEGPSEEMEILSEIVPAMMEQAVELSIPLIVDYNQGNNWYEL